MAYNHENIIVGAADVYIGESTDVFPATYTAGVSARTALSTALTHVGLTTGGIELAYAPDFGEVEVDQYLDVAKMFKQRQSVTVSTTFAEATLENLLFAWGQNFTASVTGTATDRVADISAGNLGDRPEERKLAFVGQAPGAVTGTQFRERVYELERVLSVESTTFGLSRSEASTIPVSLRCLPIGDPAGGGTYGRIIERTVTPA